MALPMRIDKPDGLRHFTADTAHDVARATGQPSLRIISQVGFCSGKDMKFSNNVGLGSLVGEPLWCTKGEAGRSTRPMM